MTQVITNLIIVNWFNYTADCGEPVLNAKLNYSSTLEGSVLILTCENDTSTDKQTLSVTCHSNGSWIPDPADFTCSSFTTVPSGSYNTYCLKSINIVTCMVSIIINNLAKCHRWQHCHPGIIRLLHTGCS